MTLEQLVRQFRWIVRETMREAAGAAIAGTDPRHPLAEMRACEGARWAGYQALKAADQLRAAISKVVAKDRSIARDVVEEALAREEADRRAAYTGLIAT